MQKKALMVIDLQNDITKNYRDIIGNVNRAIDWAVRNELWVVYIQHNNLSAGDKDIQAGYTWRGAGTGDEGRIRSYLYKVKKQCTYKRDFRCIHS